MCRSTDCRGAILRLSSWLSPSGAYELRVGRHAEDTDHVLVVSLSG
jgi:hypothetical protein